jgi:hypothetical protein
VVAWIECTIVVSHVVAVDAIGQVAPLVSFRGRYGAFDPR